MANFNTSKMGYHPTTEKIVTHLSSVTQNQNKTMFRTLLTYYFGMIASHMRVGVHGWGDKVLPVNIYAISISESGTGKGFTLNTMKDEITDRFRNVFLEETFPTSAEASVDEIAEARSIRRNTDLDKEAEKLIKEYGDAGEMMFQFSEGTPAAAKQIRHKLCIAKAGAINFIVDEIGVNLLGQKDMINLFLELYDTGKVEDKLVKNTSENKRVERIEDSTPTNMLLLGAGSALLDGSETERNFNALLETGYARRCFISFNRDDTKVNDTSAEDLLRSMFDKKNNKQLSLIAEQLEELADISNLNKVMKLEYDDALYLMEYKLYCVHRGAKFKDHQKILKSEMDNRFFKVLKLASAYAFCDGLDNVPKDYINYAIHLAEDCGDDFRKLMTPEKDYMKLAKFLLDYPEGATLSDLDQNLKVFKGNKQAKEEMITNAISWGYKNNILVSKHWIDQILFLKASALEETDLDNLIVSVSNHAADGYEAEEIEFEQLADFGEAANYNWCNHHFVNEHRHQDNLILGFNVVVFDVDDGTPMSTAKMMFQDYWNVMYETKRSTEENNRYRIILPISHVLELDRDEYKQFMRNLIESLPFDAEVDEASLQPDKKWLTCNKGAVINDVRWIKGKEHDPIIFNALPYIPKTAKNEQLMTERKDIQNLDNIQRWVYENTGEGNRSNQLYRYAMILVDMGCQFHEVEQSLLELNNNLRDPLPEKEIKNTILLTVSKKIGSN